MLGLYARISTSDGQQQIETQLRQLRRFAEIHREEYKEYTDEISGADFNRPGLDALITDSFKGRIDKVVVCELSRLGRSSINIQNILENFQRWDVDLVILNMDIDTSKPAGKFFFQVISAVTEYERELIRERVIRGMERARAEGKRIGRPERKVKREILEYVSILRQDGFSWPRIADEVGIPQTTIYRKFQAFQKGRG